MKHCVLARYTSNILTAYFFLVPCNKKRTFPLFQTLAISSEMQAGLSAENDGGKQKTNLAEIIDVVGSPGTPNSAHLN